MNNLSDLIYDNEDENKLIYHYTKFETIIKIIVTKKLRFNNYGDSNDPYETKKLYFNILTNKNNKSNSSIIDQINNKTTLIKICEEKYQSIINNYKILCFCKDKKFLEKNSLSNRGLSKLRMWAQYGDTHKGFCLIINKDIFHKTMNKFYIEKFISNDVSYQNLFEKGAHNYRSNISSLYLNDNYSNIEEVIKNNIKKYPLEMFFLKDIDWEHENEYRYVLFNEDKNIDSYIDISDSLKGLIIGKEVSKEFVDILKNICIKYGLFIKRLNFTDYFFLEDII